MLSLDDPRIVKAAMFLEPETTPKEAMASFSPDVQATIRAWWNDPLGSSVSFSDAEAANENVSRYVAQHNSPVVRELIESFTARLIKIAPGAVITTDFHRTPNQIGAIHIDNLPRASLPFVRALPGVNAADATVYLYAQLNYAGPQIASSDLKAAMGWRGNGRTVGVIDTGVSHANIIVRKAVDMTSSPSGLTPVAPPCHWHGTAVAGNVASNLASFAGKSYLGPADQAAIYDIRIYNGSPQAAAAGLSCSQNMTGVPVTTLDLVVAAINEAANAGLAYVDISTGGSDGAFDDGTHAVDAAIDNAVETQGMLVAVAAGNNGNCPCPGSASSPHVLVPGGAWNAITIGSVEHHCTTDYALDTKRPTSAWNDATDGPQTIGGPLKPDLMAPGRRAHANRPA